MPYHHKKKSYVKKELREETPEIIPQDSKQKEFPGQNPNVFNKLFFSYNRKYYYLF